MAPLLSVDPRGMRLPPLKTSIYSCSLLQQLFDQDMEAAYRERCTYTEEYQRVFRKGRVLPIVIIQMVQVKEVRYKDKAYVD